MKLILTLFVAVLRTASLRVTEAQLEAAIIELFDTARYPDPGSA